MPLKQSGRRASSVARNRLSKSSRAKHPAKHFNYRSKLLSCQEETTSKRRTGYSPTSHWLPPTDVSGQSPRRTHYHEEGCDAGARCSPAWRLVLSRSVQLFVRRCPKLMATHLILLRVLFLLQSLPVQGRKDYWPSTCLIQHTRKMLGIP